MVQINDRFNRNPVECYRCKPEKVGNDPVLNENAYFANGSGRDSEGYRAKVMKQILVFQINSLEFSTHDV
jgi:hypothetical protein